MAEKVIIGGGSGLIGRALTQRLEDEGYEVAWLSRSSGRKEVQTIGWNPVEGVFPAEEIKEFDHFINLAGAGIADQRWTPKRKNLITQSRVQPNLLFAEALKEEIGNLKSYVSSSAIGIYGDSGSQWVTEDDTPTNSGFLHESCSKWENSIQKVAERGLRTAWLRTGIVLSPKGGALEKMLLPLKLGVSGYFGSGRQYYSWIHIEDMVELYIKAMQSNWSGPYNAVAPHPVSMKEFSEVLADVAKGYQWVLPVPALGLKISMGEMSKVLLNSNRVSAQKVLDNGFVFKFESLEEALKDLL